MSDLSFHNDHEIVHTTMALEVSDAAIVDGQLIINKNRYYEQFNHSLRCNTCKVDIPMPEDYTHNP